jgi:hypothetical protein
MPRYLTALAAILVAALGVSLVAQDRAPVRTIKDGVLDEIRLFADRPPQTVRVAIRPFSATAADLTEGETDKDETKRMQADGPKLLADQFVAELKERGPFSDVSVLSPDGSAPADAVIVEGKFIELDPGSRAKRYFVGFGAGKSGVTVEGVVKTADGTQLATFKQRRVGVMGAAGGDSMEKLRSDTTNIAEDIAKFLSAWAKGEKLD